MVQDQVWSRSRRRPPGVRRPAMWRSRWRRVLGVARRSGPVRLICWARTSRSWAAKASCIQVSLFTTQSKGRLARPQALVSRMDVLGSGSLALEQLEAGDVVIVEVGDERCVAHAFDGVEQGELGAGVGALAAHDHPGPRRPGRQVHQVGELGDLCAGAGPAVAVDRRDPGVVDGEGDGVADGAGDREPEREADVAVPAGFDEPVRGAAGVSPRDDLLGGIVGVISSSTTGSGW